MIEAEIRALITHEQYTKLDSILSRQAKPITEEHQETWYYDLPVDFRIQKSGAGAKIWMKEGKMHADARKEYEVQLKKDDFGTCTKMFEKLGFKIKVKWLRHRKMFSWKGITVCLDNSKGYGQVIE